MKLLLTLTALCAINSNYAEFVATSEWQFVPEGESLPAGLHYRLDLEKGGRWAKLLSEEDKNHVPENLEKAEIIVHEDANFDPEMAKKRERVAELAEIWDELQDQVVSDFKQMDELVISVELFAYKAFQNNITDEESDKFEDVIDNFGILLSQVDNAMDAVKHGILGQLLRIFEKFPHRNILRLFSSAAQNNPPVAKALKNALRPILEDVIVNSGEKDPILKSALFCLSAITRSLTVKVDDGKVEGADFFPGERVLDEGAVLEFDWKNMVSARGNNDKLCTLVYDLKLPFACGKGKHEL
jgi:nucleotide exchange factor SIL1